MKKIIFLTVIIMAFGLMSNSSCDDRTNTADYKTGVKQEQMMREGQAQVGMPAIVNFQEMKMVKMLYELRDQENLICYCYLVNEMNGSVGQFLGKCLGFGIPYATQFSNPMKPITGCYPANYQENTIPQSEPNGLFMPSSAEGTWVMLIDPKTNKIHPTYVEPKVLISPVPLKPLSKE